MKLLSKRLLACVCLGLSISAVNAQQVDLFKMQDSTNAAENKKTVKEPVVNTFYSTRLINSHTVEILV